jgi:hypothetical protein
MERETPRIHALLSYTNDGNRASVRGSAGAALPKIVAKALIPVKRQIGRSIVRKDFLPTGRKWS